MKTTGKKIALISTAAAALAAAAIFSLAKIRSVRTAKAQAVDEEVVLFPLEFVWGGVPDAGESSSGEDFVPQVSMKELTDCSLEPLKDGQHFEYDNKGGLYVYAAAGEEMEEYYTNPLVRWGKCEISYDRKRILFFEQEPKLRDGYRNMFLIDGETGKIKSYGHFPLNFKMDKKGKYVLFEGTDKNTISVLDLEGGKFIREGIKVPIKEFDKWEPADFSFYRSADNDEFDYFIEYGFETSIIAKVYYRISDNSFFVEFDASETKNRDELRDLVIYGDDFYGKYPLSLKNKEMEN